MKKTRILFVEDDLDYRYLIERELEKEKDFELCAACSDGETAVQAALLHQPDIVLMDLSLGNSTLNGAEAAREIRLQTDSRVIILTSHENYDTVIHASTQALASAYLFKSNFSVLIPTIRETARGVTPQAQLICSALLAPLTNAERSVLLRILGEDVRCQPAFLQQNHLQPADRHSAQAGSARPQRADAYFQSLWFSKSGKQSRFFLSNAKSSPAKFAGLLSSVRGNYLLSA